LEFWNTHNSITPILLLLLVVVSFAAKRHRDDRRRIDIRDVHEPLADFNRGSHAAHHVPIDTDAQRSSLGIAFAGCQRHAELARQLGRTLGEQTGGKLQTCCRPNLRRSDIGNHKAPQITIVVAGPRPLLISQRQRSFENKGRRASVSSSKPSITSFQHGVLQSS
jgi:hypothetical protein